MGDTISTDRLEQAGDVTEDDLAILDSIELDQDAEELAASDSRVEVGASLNGGESDAVTTDLDGSEDGASEDEEATSDEDDSDEDSDQGEDADEPEDAQEGTDESEEDSDDAPDTTDAEDEAGDEDDADPEPEVIEKATQSYEQTRKAVLDEVASKFIPVAESAQKAAADAEAELAAIEKKYSEPDEDGFIPSLTVADQRRIVQLERQREKAVETLERVKSEFTPAVQKAEREVMIQHNLNTYPKLKAVEAGFREALNRGITFESVAEAVEVSSALMRVKGQATAPRAPKVAAKPKPKPGEIERAALEASIARKKAGAVTAGRGSNGSKGATPKGNPYKGLPPEVVEGLRMWDEALASS